jgi:CubicO group peptidase (beta-lactamase class C family)
VIAKKAHLLLLLLLLPGCGARTIVPEGGYAWPETARDYWPTDGWKTAPMEEHGVDPAMMEKARAFARADRLTRCLLVVRSGYVVFEEYYGGGGRDVSTETWSVTKSFASALVGIAMGQGHIAGVEQKMTEYFPQHPAFGDIRIAHALTHTTGLRFSEEGMSWIRWISAEDWVAEALARGQDHEEGANFRYSSANSHFLMALIRAASGKTPGELAEEHLFKPLGIPFRRLTEIRKYANWDEYKVAIPGSWRQDPKGTEIGGFGLCLTAREMAKFGYLYLNRGKWDGRTVIPDSWVEESTRDQVPGIRRYSYGYQWWIADIAGHPGFLASGLGGQIIGVVPSLDLVVVIKYETVTPQRHTDEVHDDMKLFSLVVESVR